MTSRREALHFEDLYLSRETLSTSLVEELCHVSQKTAVLIMMNTFVSERDMRFVS